MPISCLSETCPTLWHPCFSPAAAPTWQLSLLCSLLGVLKGNLFYFLLYLFLMVYFYQHAPMDIYFILWVVVIEASTLSCCSICSSFGHWKCSQVASCALSAELPLVIFPSVLSTFSVLALHNVPAHRVLLLPPSWKHPCLQGIAVLSFGSLENGICGVRTQRGELVLPDVLLPDSLPDSQWCTGSSRCVCLGSTW